MPHDVFISYAKKDRAVALKVCDELERNGLACWIAPRDIAPAQKYGEVILSALKACKVVVLVFSEHALRSVHVEAEVDRAYNYQKPIIQLRIADVPPTGSFEYYLSTSQWLDAHPALTQEKFEALVRSTQAIVGERERTTGEQPPPKTSPTWEASWRWIKRSRARLMGGSALVAGITAFVLWTAPDTGAGGTDPPEAKGDTAGFVPKVEGVYSGRPPTVEPGIDSGRAAADSGMSLGRVGLTPQLRNEYEGLFRNCRPDSSRLEAIDRIVSRIVQNRGRYQQVQAETGVPWTVVAVLHHAEGGLSFTRHLINGDPLRGRTVRVPAGRPVEGEPPFTWEESAVDALRLKRLDKWQDWSIAGSLYALEAYNGWGYRLQHPYVRSPYLWSFSNHYESGKYTAEGGFSDTAASAQTGAAVLLKRLYDTGHGPPSDTSGFRTMG